MSSFEDVWRRVRLEMPAVPALLARSWAQDAYTDLCDRWPWAFLRAESTLVIAAARSFDVVVTNGSLAVTSAALFVASDAGRQLKVGQLPLYTIASVTDASNIVLDRLYTEDTDGAATITILDAYVTMPADFRRFLVIVDRYNQRPIPFWFSEDQLAISDPGRFFGDSTVRYLVARKYSSTGRVQYEFWPAPTAARTYPFLYIRSGELLADATELPGVLFSRPDILRNYVLARGAMWPGTNDAKNPFFSPQAANIYRTEYETEVQRLTLTDDNEYPQQYMPVHWDRRMAGISGPGELLRASDATTVDYY